MKNPTHRHFEYKPIYYHPEEVEDENEPRIKFRRIVKRREVPKRSPVMLIILILVLIFLLKYLGGLTTAEKKAKPSQAIQVKIID